MWLTALGAARPGEPGKNRPVIVVSADLLMAGPPHELIVVVPLSSSLPPLTLRPEVGDVEGVDRSSLAIPRAIRGVARSRLLHKLGVLPPGKLAEIERVLTQVLGLTPSRSRISSHPD